MAKFVVDCVANEFSIFYTMLGLMNDGPSACIGKSKMWLWYVSVSVSVCVGVCVCVRVCVCVCVCV